MGMGKRWLEMISAITQGLCKPKCFLNCNLILSVWDNTGFLAELPAEICKAEET